MHLVYDLGEGDAKWMLPLAIVWTGLVGLLNSEIARLREEFDAEALPIVEMEAHRSTLIEAIKRLRPRGTAPCEFLIISQHI
ncbi:hypothetical protein BOTBODRAFT_64957 [Botryobasidium botryosum FD-172 SS1]|uniref:Uncharacterized protein n=1 Tax=Botryobasidium botryosum (strain FD-172 SS1) TaxID=930990 RepID=A0A067MNU9_BOTB1|nr:hypothetical protein BOTBODRAFT_64957 [Botryobasidium botryosum FD-172 SS1]